MCLTEEFQWRPSKVRSDDVEKIWCSESSKSYNFITFLWHFCELKSGSTPHPVQCSYTTVRLCWIWGAAHMNIKILICPFILQNPWHMNQHQEMSAWMFRSRKIWTGVRQIPLTSAWPDWQQLRGDVFTCYVSLTRMQNELISFTAGVLKLKMKYVRFSFNISPTEWRQVACRINYHQMMSPLKKEMTQHSGKGSFKWPIKQTCVIRILNWT